MALFQKKCWWLLLLFPLFFAACGPREIKEDVSGRKKVLSTIAQIHDLVAAIGADRIEAQVLIQGELNPHTYELVKGDDEKIQSAEIIFYNGLGLEHGASVSAILASHPNTLAVGETIASLQPDKILHKGPLLDPHIWMDISLWKESIDPIAEKLSQIDPDGREGYLQRAALLKEKMEKADAALYARLQAIPSEKRFLVTSHDAFNYFARAYLAEPGEADWEKRFAAPEGLAPDGQLNPIDLQKIIDHLNKYHIEVLFPESNVSRDSIRKIASAGKQKGLDVRICREALYGDAFRGTYLDSMHHNGATISRHLETP